MPHCCSSIMWDTVLPRTFVRAAPTPQTAFLSVSLIPLVLFSNVSEGPAVFQSSPSWREACIPARPPLPSPHSSWLPLPFPPYLWAFSSVTERSTKRHLVRTVLHFSFQIIVSGNQKEPPQYQKGTCLFLNYSVSPTKPSWNHSASPHSHTAFPHRQLWIQFWNTVFQNSL